jgi:hypothetical protein
VNAIWEQRQMARAALCDPRDEDEPEVRPVTVLPAGAVAETLFAYTRHWLAISPPGDGLVDRVTVPAAPATNNGLKQQPYPAPIA